MTPQSHRVFIRTERGKVEVGYRDFRMDLIFRYGKQCLCCGARDTRLQIDHIRPVALGGLTRLDNLQLLCPDCNEAKGCQTIDYRPKRKARS